MAAQEVLTLDTSVPRIEAPQAGDTYLMPRPAVVGKAGVSTGSVGLAGITSGVVTITVADAAGTWTMKLPASAGLVNQLLATDGSGNLSWTTVAGISNGVTTEDVGSAPNEVPLNGYLGSMAFQSAEATVLKPQASAVPAGIGDMIFQLTNDTTLVVKVKGSDGTVRSATLTLA